MTADALQLQIGSTLQLEPLGDGFARREVVQVIGYLPSRSLIVTTPSRNGRAQIVPPGRRYAVRLLIGNCVQGFVSTVLQAYVRPYPHLHLSYPHEVERILVRDSERVPTRIPCEFRRGCDPDRAHRSHGALLDLSVTGARLGFGGPALAPEEPIEIRFDLEVARSSEHLELQCTVRNTGESPPAGDRGSEEEPGRFAGLRFAGLERFSQVLLHAWVLERATEPHRAC